MTARLATVLALAGLAAGCRPAAPAPDPQEALVGVWEITGEAGTLNRNGQRYHFADDGSLQITRPRPLGPTTTIHASYAFVSDSTLEIRSEFDAETVAPVISGDTLYLRPLSTGEPMRLVRVPEAAPADSAVAPPPSL